MTTQDIDIPEWWTSTNLWDITQIVSGSTPSTKEPSYWDGDIPWITPKDLSSFQWTIIYRGERNITPVWLQNSSAQMLPINTVLFSSRAPIGYVAIAGTEVCTNQGFKNMICDEVNSHYKFIYYWLKVSTEQIEKLSSGSTFSEASASLMRSLPINLPTISEQKGIASILSSFDDKIELLRKQNATLEKTAQTIFQEWFGKYSIDDELPEGWVFDKMETLIWELEAGRRPKWWVWEIKSWIPSIWAENVKGLLTSNFSNVKFIPESFYASMNVWKIKDNDILIYKDGWAPWEFRPNFTIIGGWYPFNEWAINEHVFRLQAKKDFQQYYLFFWLTWRISIWELKSIWGKAAIPWINGTDFKNLTLLIPEEVILKKFHDCIKPLIKKVLWNNLQIQNLSWSRDTLLPKLMSGEIRV